MNSEMTIAALLATFALIAFSYYKSKRPKEIGKAWTVPWMAVIFLCIIMALALINHLFTLNSPNGTPGQRPPTIGAIGEPVPFQDFVHL
jgi:hypothetical protein